MTPVPGEIPAGLVPATGGETRFDKAAVLAARITGEVPRRMERLLKVPEVAALLNVSRPTVYRYVELGLPAVRLSEGVLRFRERDVEAWVMARAASARR